MKPRGSRCHPALRGMHRTQGTRETKTRRILWVFQSSRQKSSCSPPGRAGANTSQPRPGDGAERTDASASTRPPLRLRCLDGQLAWGRHTAGPGCSGPHRREPLLPRPESCFICPSTAITYSTHAQLLRSSSRQQICHPPKLQGAVDRRSTSRPLFPRQPAHDFLQLSEGGLRVLRRPASPTPR